VIHCTICGRLGHLVHGVQSGDRVVGHTVATLSEPCHQEACLDHQLSHLGQQPGQHLPLGRLALGKQVMFFDRLEDRLHLCECWLDAHHRAGFELR
jgi:hypothetical protein